MPTPLTHEDTKTYTQATFKPLLNKLVRTPEYFKPHDLQLALEHIFTPGSIDPTQIGAFLTALHISRLERRPESLAVAASLLRARAIPATVDHGDEDFVVDIVGTGGDGHNTFNVSTTAAIVAAGAGARVIKHGSRASTSSSGSADLLERLDCLFTPPTPGTTVPFPRIPFQYILAPHYHPSLAFIAPYRKLLPFRTMFNVLGPLINPARPKGMVLGICEPELGTTFAQSLFDGGVEKALIVCGVERLDEISCAGPTRVWELSKGADGKDKVDEYLVDPVNDFGLPTHPLEDVAGHSPEENAKVFVRLLHPDQGLPSDADKETIQKHNAITDFVLINASALLVVAGVASNFKHGVELARESITSGKAWQALQTFRESLHRRRSAE
ncbi:anthranilate phosphoribosyltransferase TrpD [Thelephora ganbajun]|uniref:Anthranilate phosphoribosyltransferase TrpD n=1 Tax=Thelephora ganbajun TaxID=370292 RepID=A0ACB6ZAF5_THEGA|nr:anthranilate phosphoribosyltransferase TrpD [Thelephora ganbajun]